MAADRSRKPRSGVTPFQARFIVEYLKDLNGAAAVRRAGSKTKRPDQEAYELLRKPEVATRIAEAHKTQMAAADLTATRILEEIRRIATVDIRDYFDVDGDLKPVSTWTPEMGAACSSFEVIMKNAEAGDGEIDRVHKIRLWNKVQTLDLACQHLALLTPVVDNAPLGPTFVFPEGTRIKIE